PMASPDGSVRGAIVGLRDIHHEVLARQALQVSEQQYRMLAENASDVVAQLDATDALTWVSPSVEQVLGWAPEQIVGANLVELVHRADRAPAAQWRAHLPTDATSDPVELRLLTADGSYRWVSLLARSTTDAAGLVSGRVVGMRDVHEQVLARLALANSQRRYKMLAENATDVVWQLDADTVLQWVTPSVEAVLGWAPEQLLGKAAIDLVHPDDAGTLTSWRAAVFDGTTASGFELRLLTGDGDYRWMSLQARPITGGDGTIDGAVVGLRDIHEQVLAREQLATSERMFRLAMAGAPQGMAVVGLQGQLTQVNEALCQLAGRNLAWMEEHCEYDFIHPDDREADLAARDLLLAGEAEFDIHEGRLVTAAGAVVWVEHSLALIRDEHNTPLFYVSQYQDITAARAAKAQLLHQAQHDQLTGLINRGQLQERISSVVDRGPQSGGVCALLFCDLDYFKNVNDSYGHAGGDDVLRVTAERMASALREGDEVARLGGDEFVIVLSDVHDLSAAVAVAQKVRDAVAEPLPVEAEQVSITLSIGVALATPGIEAHRLLRNADAALYEAKNSGRDRIAVFSNQQ
ncbi:MAG: PAS domain S-box protein, partial [Actinomycetes bacterium]